MVSDFYQPLDADQEYFIDPYLRYEQYNLDLFNDAYGKAPASGSIAPKSAWK